MAESDAAIGRRGQPSASSELSGKNRILIVDDEEMVRRTFANVLAVELPNLSIDQAKDGNAAIEAFRKDRHNVILMDLSMPVKDGLAAFMEIEKLCREEKWAMPSVVFCTGYDPSQAVRNVVAGNPQHCMLRKPVGSSILVDAVRSRLLS